MRLGDPDNTLATHVYGLTTYSGAFISGPQVMFAGTTLGGDSNLVGMVLPQPERTTCL